jgi:hypothetical protein
VGCHLSICRGNKFLVWWWRRALAGMRDLGSTIWRSLISYFVRSLNFRRCCHQWVLIAGRLYGRIHFCYLPADLPSSSPHLEFRVCVCVWIFLVFILILYFSLISGFFSRSKQSMNRQRGSSFFALDASGMSLSKLSGDQPRRLFNSFSTATSAQTSLENASQTISKQWRRST